MVLYTARKQTNKWFCILQENKQTNKWFCILQENKQTNKWFCILQEVKNWTMGDPRHKAVQILDSVSYPNPILLCAWSGYETNTAHVLLW